MNRLIDEMRATSLKYANMAGEYRRCGVRDVARECHLASEALARAADAVAFAEASQKMSMPAHPGENSTEGNNL